MKIPETHICDIADCAMAAVFRITHEILGEPNIPGHMAYGRDWGRAEILVFEFCDEHAYGFSIAGRGAWMVPSALKPRFPGGI